MKYSAAQIIPFLLLLRAFATAGFLHGLSASSVLPWPRLSWGASRLTVALQSSPEPRSIVDSTTEDQPKRRRKKNKYEKFSKVDSLEVDPFEALIAESLQENELLHEELVENKKKKRRSDGASSSGAPIVIDAPPMSFPDGQFINPYDPTTFGYIEIGSIGGAHGVHGLVKVRCLTDFAAERLCTAGVRHIKAPNRRAPRPIILLEGRLKHGDDYLVRLQGIDDRDAAMKLRGSILFAREEDFIETEEDEYVVADLVGLDVFLFEDKEIGERSFVGTVNGVVFAEDLTDIPGLHDFIELVLPRGEGGTASLFDELVLVPFVPQLVPVVDLENRAIYIDPPEGLLDLTYVREEKTRLKGFLPAPRSAGEN